LRKLIAPARRLRPTRSANKRRASRPRPAWDSIEHAYAHFQQAVGVAALPDDVLKIMAEKHIFLVPTDATLDLVMVRRNDPPQDRARIEEEIRTFFEADAARLRRAIQAGVPIAAGSDN